MVANHLDRVTTRVNSSSTLANRLLDFDLLLLIISYWTAITLNEQADWLACFVVLHPLNMAVASLDSHRSY